LLPSLLPPVLRELKEWTVARRSHAAGVLSAILVFAEGHAVSFIPDILSALGNSCRDEEITVAGRAFSWYVTFFFFGTDLLISCHIKYIIKYSFVYSD